MDTSNIDISMIEMKLSWVLPACELFIAATSESRRHFVLVVTWTPDGQWLRLKKSIFCSVQAANSQFELNMPWTLNQQYGLVKNLLTFLSRWRLSTHLSQWPSTPMKLSSQPVWNFQSHSTWWSPIERLHSRRWSGCGRNRQTSARHPFHSSWACRLCLCQSRHTGLEA